MIKFTKDGKMIDIFKEDGAYLIIYEDGSIDKTNKLTSEDIDSCNDGIISIIDITYPLYPHEFVDGEWSKINRRNESND